MHDAMSDRHEIVEREVRGKPSEGLVEHLVQIFGDHRFQGNLAGLAAIGEMEPQRRMPEIDHALADSRGFTGDDAEKPDLDRRRAWVERKQ
jgi:hypothetical protein